ncbi:hypothetical protein Fmac_026667 [Flemingia macrophylla]|uniref:Uncharacterized protein n=1 Tax=Flemingia macrophylla TaxID=520843 RepID=A0ABD1LFH1_9FABA
MDPSEKGVSDEVLNGGVDGSNTQPQAQSDIEFICSYCKCEVKRLRGSDENPPPANGGVKEEQKEKEKVGGEHDHAFNEVDNVAREPAAKEHEGRVEDSVAVGEKKEESEQDATVVEINEGFGAAEEAVEAKEFNEVDDHVGEENDGSDGSEDNDPIAPPKILNFDLNEMPPEEEDEA